MGDLTAIRCIGVKFRHTMGCGDSDATESALKALTKARGAPSLQSEDTVEVTIKLVSTSKTATDAARTIVPKDISVPCMKHPSYRMARPPTADCRTCRQAFRQKHIFTLGIVKGLVEHDLLSKFFTSTVALKGHIQDGINHGFLKRFPNGGIDMTAAGRRLYDEMNLKEAPEARAYSWVVSAWFKEE